MKGTAMDINLHAATIALSHHGVATVRGARGARIVAVSGSLWITQDGDRRDYFLDAGEDLDITTEGAVVIQGQADSRFAVLRRPVVRLPVKAEATTGPRRGLASFLAHWLGPDRIDRMAGSGRLVGI
jgi:hypothetical protein